MKLAMRELKYYVACTVDRFIAGPNGEIDGFLPAGPHLADLFATFPETVPTHMREALGVDGENRWFDTVLMGRKTYTVGSDAGLISPYSHLRQYLFSRTLGQSPDPRVELVSDDPLAVVKRLKAESGKDIWLCGGGDLATQLFPEIDEMILKVNPVLLGSGIPLFSGPIPQTSLALVDQKTYPNGFMICRYRLPH